MEITPKTNVIALIEAYPFIEDFLVSLSDKFKLLKNPIMRNTVGKVATLEQAAAMGGLPLEELLSRLKAEVEKSSNFGDATNPPQQMAPLTAGQRQELLRSIIQDLHNGLPLADAQTRFNAHFSDVGASEIAAMEQALMASGVPQSDIKRLCEVHVQVFKGALNQADLPSTPLGHPVNTFMTENRALEKVVDKIEAVLKEIGSPVSPEIFARYRASLSKLQQSLGKVDIHYLRKENQLFPRLEEHGITGPSQVMWGIHNDIRAMLKSVGTLMAGVDYDAVVTELSKAVAAIKDMIYKEEHILFPLCLETLSEQDWLKAKEGEEEIGYAWITPEPMEQNKGPQPEILLEGESIALATGMLTPEQINLMLIHLPVDLTFVDEFDEVKYYSATKARIFPRSPGIIGRKVQNCHPPRSMPRVQEILNAFREGTSDRAEFWIQHEGRFIHIRYFAMRSESAEYRGCLEVSQDVTEIKALSGEKRLLD